MNLLPSPERARPTAILLALIALALAYFFGVHWWFTAPHIAIAGEMRDLREQEVAYRRKSAAREDIEKSLAEVRSAEASSAAFLPEADFDAAAAGLIQRVEQVTLEFARSVQSCQVLGKTPMRGTEEEPFERVVLTVRMRCSFEELAPILHKLESGQPMLFVDETQIARWAGYRDPQTGKALSTLDVRFNVYGYLRNRAAAANANGRRGT
ncbi:MAG: type II secretion system protein GspM [Lysobacterales bacterium]